MEVSVYVPEFAHRQGIGRTLYMTFFELLEQQGYVSAFAGITCGNAASVSLHLAAGFELVGVYRDVGYKLAQWHDVAWNRRAIRAPGNEAPGEPYRLSAMLLDNGAR